MRSGSLFKYFHVTCMWKAILDFFFFFFWGYIAGQIFNVFFCFVFFHFPEFCRFWVFWILRWGGVLHGRLIRLPFHHSHSPFAQWWEKSHIVGLRFNCVSGEQLYGVIYITSNPVVCFLFDFPSKCWSVKKKKKKKRKNPSLCNLIGPLVGWNVEMFRSHGGWFRWSWVGCWREAEVPRCLNTAALFLQPRLHDCLCDSRRRSLALQSNEMSNCKLAPATSRSRVDFQPSSVEGRINASAQELLLFLNGGECIKSLFYFFCVCGFRILNDEITAFIWRKSALIKALSRCFILILGGLIWKHPSLLPLEVNKGCFLKVSRLFHGGGKKKK